MLCTSKARPALPFVAYFDMQASEPFWFSYVLLIGQTIGVLSEQMPRLARCVTCLSLFAAEQKSRRKSASAPSCAWSGGSTASRRSKTLAE